jgi:outer membrane protein OmpA-like peptidoglycan-associated protein
MKSSLAIAFSLCAIACAHREPVQRSTVSAVGNKDVSHDAQDPDNQKMHYTEVSNEDALNRDRETQEREAMQGHLGHSDVPAAALLPADNTANTTATAKQPEKCGMNVYFSTASADLTPQAKQQLDAVAGCLKREHTHDDALIVGSADPRGSQQDNAMLGEERARKVAQYLKSLGIEEGDIRIRSVGESQASAARDTYPSSRKAQVKSP